MWESMKHTETASTASKEAQESQGQRDLRKTSLSYDSNWLTTHGRQVQDGMVLDWTAPLLIGSLIWTFTSICSTSSHPSWTSASWSCKKTYFLWVASWAVWERSQQTSGFIPFLGHSAVISWTVCDNPRFTLCLKAKMTWVQKWTNCIFAPHFQDNGARWCVTLECNQMYHWKAQVFSFKMMPCFLLVNIIVCP